MKVFVMDMLCMVPYYDGYLCSALQKKVPGIKLGAISFHLQPDFFSDHTVLRHPGFIDLVTRFKIRSKTIRRFLKFSEYILNLILLLVQFIFVKPDIIHIQWIPLVVKLPIELWFLRIMQKRGVKLVYTVHNLLPHDTGDRHRQTFHKVYRMMDMLVCHTNQTRSDLVTQFCIPEHKTVVIPFGPNIQDTQHLPTADARQMLGIDTDKVMALYFGSIRPYKGLEFLLEAWKHVVDQAPRTALLFIAGNGQKEYLNNIEQLIDHMGVTVAVRTDLRFIPEEELLTLIHASDILVYPYKDVTQSAALLSGMLFGKAIVATNVGGFRETLEHDQTALLVDYGDCTQLADNLSRLIKNQADRQRLGQAVKAHLEMNYSWENIAEQTLCVYNRLTSYGTSQGANILNNGMLHGK